ncbi:CBS domain-containing protein [Caldimonas sp. KR1-144]|uniref:CBS domain-containing protein n=1 Tax=Caldimonas sp. KR1-144 TaxID=3400911 RepID=UPI003BFCE3D3
MKVSEAMTRDVCVASPDDTLEQAACMMADLDAGVLPIGSNDRLVGMLTDRDIAVRGVAQGKGPQTTVKEVMSPEVKYCYEDDDLDEVAQNMGDIRVRRLPVLNRDKRLVGIVSLGDIATHHNEPQAGQALGGISRPGGQHSQRMDA